MALSHLLDTSVYCQPIKPKPLAPVRERWTALGDDSLAESAPSARLFTLDRDFLIYRQRDDQPLPLLAPFAG